MKTIKLSHFNINIALKILSLMGFTYFFMYSIFTGSVNRYVHPRIIPFMIFASVAMLVIAVLLLGELFKPQKKKTNSWALLFYIIPLIMAFVLPAQSFDSNTKIVGDVQLAGNESIDSNKGNLQEHKPNDESGKDVTENTSKADATTNEDSNNTIPLKNGVLVMDSNNFYSCMNEVYTNLDKYVGTQIEVVGFVFNDNENFKDNEFVPARLMMVCCAADMQPVGFLCRYEQASKLKSDSWVKVTGVIRKTEFEGEGVPSIEAKSVVETEKPNDDYIYPY